MKNESITLSSLQALGAVKKLKIQLQAKNFKNRLTFKFLIIRVDDKYTHKLRKSLFPKSNENVVFM